MENRPNKGYRKTSILALLGFTLGFAVGNNKPDMKIVPLTTYDITGDGVQDYIVESGFGSDSERIIDLGYVNGNEVLRVSKSPAELSNFPETITYERTGSVRRIGPAINPGIKEKNRAYFTSRTVNIRPTEDQKTLEIVVSDGTIDGIAFEKVTPTGLPNPKYGK